MRTEDYCLTRAEAARRESRPTLFADAASRYLAWAKQEYVRSYTFREKALKHLIAAFGSKALEEISTSGVEQYQISRRDAGAAPGTVNRERAVVTPVQKSGLMEAGEGQPGNRDWQAGGARGTAPAPDAPMKRPVCSWSSLTTTSQ